MSQKKNSLWVKIRHTQVWVQRFFLQSKWMQQVQLKLQKEE